MLRRAHFLTLASFHAPTITSEHLVTSSVKLFLFLDSCTGVCLLRMINICRACATAEVQNLITEFGKSFIGFIHCAGHHQVS